jgi:TolA-binding protein
VSESEDRVREVQKTERDLEREAGKMEDRTDELHSDIESVRQEFQRKRNDKRVTGFPHEEEVHDSEVDQAEPSGDQPG